MNRSTLLNNTAPPRYCVRIGLYTFALLVLQAVWISRLAYPALRADLLLPLMFGVAVEWPPVAGILWACLWGYAMDTLSGEFFGFHVGSYAVAVCVVHIALEKFEFHNPLYQMAFVGMCALGQTVALGMFLFVQSSVAITSTTVWVSLVIRALVITFVSPFVIYPIWNVRRGS